MMPMDPLGVEESGRARDSGGDRGPPEIAVVHLRAAAQHLRRGRLGHPPRGEDRVALRDAILEDELPEAPVVAQRRADPAPADLEAVRRIEPPVRLGFHPGAPPDALREIVGERGLERAAQDLRRHLRLPRAVVAHRARRRGTRQAPHHLERGARHLRDLRLEESAAIRGRVGVAFAPLHARGHEEHLAHRDAIVRAPRERRHVACDRIVETADLPFAQRRADQRRGDRLRHRHRHPARRGRVPVAVLLVDDRAVLEHEERRDAVQVEVALEVVGGIPAHDLQGTERPRRLRQHARRGGGRDAPRGEEAVDVPEGPDRHLGTQRAVVDLADGADGVAGVWIRGDGRRALVLGAASDGGRDEGEEREERPRSGSALARDALACDAARRGRTVRDESSRKLGPAFPRSQARRRAPRPAAPPTAG